MKRSWYLHIAFWCSYLLFETYVEFAWIGPSFSHYSVFDRFLLALNSEAALMPVKIGLVYYLFYIFFPQSGKPKSFWITIPLASVGFALAIIARRMVLVYISIPFIFKVTDETQELFDQALINSSFIELLFISGLAVSLKEYRLRVRWREREKSLEKEKLESELNFLKAQINPHFLFNTLNNIYALARKQAEQTPEAILKLSKLMRFMLYESRKEKIPIIEELRMIDDYIELERMRYNGRLRIEFRKTLDDETQLVAPLLLIHFVENAFKHGASESRFEAHISIFVKLEQRVLSAEIRNTKEENSPTEEREKIGLENITRQLELLYPQHQLTLVNEPKEFVVHLSIPLNEVI
jgi:two-component system, LytTR family, sensor kinase